MKKNLVVLAIVLSILSACNTRKPVQPADDTPKALEEKSSFEIVTKRGYDDLVEDLYNELSEKDPQLKDFETQLQHVSEAEVDSVKAFKIYDDKNHAYYNSGNTRLLQIKDSVLKDRVKKLIDQSLEKYKTKISLHTKLMASIDEKSGTLDDLHQVLKIVKTLPLIEKYQVDNKPSVKSLDGLSKQLDSVVKLADTLTKQ